MKSSGGSDDQLANVMFEIGLDFLHEAASESSIREAAQYFKAAADQGHAAAQCHYGICLTNGEGVSQNYVEAARYFRLSADQGNANAQFSYGLCLTTGQSASVDVIEATRYYKLAATQGHVLGQVYYALHVQNSLRFSEDLDRVAIHLRLAADRDQVDGQFGSGGGRGQGVDISVDFVAAARYFKQSADRGVSDSQVNYGGCLLNGWGVSVDHTEAVRYFKLAADQGDSYGELNYGLCLANGQGVSANVLEAVKYFKLSANKKNPNGEVLLGTCQYFGIGCCVDRPEAAEEFKVAGDEGSARGQFNYGVLVTECSQSPAELSEASKYFKMSADQDFVSGQINYGICCFEGLGVGVDYTEAAKYFKRAADEGDNDGELYYGICLLDGKGVKRDAAKAVEYFRRSANQQNLIAKVNLGFCFHRGLGVNRNTLRSAECFKEAADQGNTVGQFNYGLCCYYGDGTLVDFAEAFEYLQLAADQGFLQAITGMTACLRHLDNLSAAIFYAHRTQKIRESETRTANGKSDWGDVQRFENPIELKGVDCGTSMKFGGLSSPQVLDIKTIRANTQRPGLSNKDRVKQKLNLEIDKSSLQEVKILGSGNFGTVKLMKNSYGDQFAVKIFLRWHLSDEVLSKSFMREFEALACLSHPCVIPLYGFWRGREPGIVMKYMANGSLSDVIARVNTEEPLDFWAPTGKAIIICGFVCGMEFIHSAGFVHRDLKPGNLLIDDRGRCRIGDFGTSKFIEENNRWTGNAERTVQYAAPELYEDPPYSQKIDVFAFGLILYEILVGGPVFLPSYEEKHIMYRVLNNIRADLPEWMNEDVKLLISRCWSMKPEDRPTFSDILATLERIRFNILAGVDPKSVQAFLSEVRSEVNRDSTKSA
jgi:TPR repeat protein